MLAATVCFLLVFLARIYSDVANQSWSTWKQQLFAFLFVDELSIKTAINFLKETYVVLSAFKRLKVFEREYDFIKPSDLKMKDT